MEKDICSYIEDRIKMFNLPKGLEETIVAEMVQETLNHQNYPRREVVKYLVDVRGIHPTDACDIVDRLTQKRPLMAKSEEILREKEISLETLIDEATKK